MVEVLIPPWKTAPWAAQEFLLCRVGAGRSYLVDKAAQAETQLQQGLCQVPTILDDPNRLSYVSR